MIERYDITAHVDGYAGPRIDKVRNVTVEGTADFLHAIAFGVADDNGTWLVNLRVEPNKTEAPV